VLAVAASRLFLAPPPLAGPAIASDGDSLRLAGKRVRLIGLDAPELAQTCRTDLGDWACGRVARDRLAQLLEAGPVACRGSGYDAYGRVLATCLVGDVDVAATLIGEGLAVADDLYAREQAAAQASRAGLWAGQFDAPAQWRAQRAAAEDGFDLWEWLTRLFGG
jgi:endonuclease YncB( thermonuclease family)